MQYPLIDIGANLTHDSFDADRAEVIARARAAGVRCMIVTGSSLESSRAALELSARYEKVLYATAGIHPHHAKDFHADATTELRALLNRPNVRALGECGLDFFRDFSPRRMQEKAFAAQLELACETGLPVFLHQRDSHDRFLGILREYRSSLIRAVIHCFTGDYAELDDYRELDLHIGVTGWICDERRGRHLRDLVGRIDPARLMIETDAPYLLPRDLKPRPRSRRNEPAHLVHILETVAACRGEAPETLAQVLWQTTCGFFDLPPGRG